MPSAHPAVPHDRRMLIVSVHDVAPPFAPGVRQLLDELDRRSIRPRVLKVVPNYAGKWPLSEDAELCNLLRSEAAAGSEIVAHGWTHQTQGRMRGPLSARCMGSWFAPEAAEFLTLPEAAAREAARNARRALADTLGVEPQGFCAPAWLINREGRAAVTAAGYRYLLERGAVRDLQTGEAVPTPWQGHMGVGGFHEWLVQRGNGAVAMRAGITHGGLSRRPVVKVFLHPQRLRDSPALERVLDRLGELSARRELVTAGELFSTATGRPASLLPTRRDPLPLVSVVVPALNEQAGIARAIESVAGQQYPPDRLECVVVDNDSRDATAEVVSDLGRSWESEAGTTPRLSLVRETERGAARAKNRGASEAQGDVLVFLDADSTLSPTVARDVADAWSSGARGGSIPVLAESDDIWERGFFNAMELGKQVFGIHCQMFYLDRRLFDELGGFRHELLLAEDLELMRRAAASLGTGNGRLQRIGRSGFRGRSLDGSCIRTSPRRMRAMPWRFGMIWMLVRWTLGFVGIGRRRYTAGGPAPNARPRAVRWARRLAEGGLRLVLSSAGSHRPGKPAGLLRFLWFWDRLYIRWHRLRPVSPDGLVFFRLETYRGSQVTLPDGTRIARGDPVCRLHLRNDLVARSADTGVSSRTWRGIGGVRADLTALATRAEAGTLAHKGDPVRALAGATVHFKGAPRLGFSVVVQPQTWRLEFQRAYMMGLMALFGPRGTLRRRREDGRVPGGSGQAESGRGGPDLEVGELWMSRSELLARYLPGRDAPPPRPG